MTEQEIIENTVHRLLSEFDEIESVWYGDLADAIKSDDFLPPLSKDSPIRGTKVAVAVVRGNVCVAEGATVASALRNLHVDLL